MSERQSGSRTRAADTAGGAAASVAGDDQRSLAPTRGATPRGATLIAVGAAQPGVGKSIVASNLAAAIAGLGRQVVLVDFDPHSPRQHALFGLEPPAGGLTAWLERKRIRRDELARATSVRNLRLLPNIEPADTPLSSGRRRAIVDELYDLETRHRRRRGHRQRQPRRPVRMSSGRARCGCWSRRAHRRRWKRRTRS